MSYVETFYQVNPDINYRIKKIKFALNDMQRDELLSIAEKTNYKHYLIIKTQLETGLRVNELCNLAIYQINFNQNTIIIESRKATKYLKTFNVKTLSSNRIVPITNELSNILRSFIGNRKNDYVFLSNKTDSNNRKVPYYKNSVIGFINEYAKKCKSIGRNIGSHSLRRTYASYLNTSKITIEDISKLLGHSSIRTTMLYLYEIESMDFDEIRKKLKKMNKIKKK